MQCDICLRPGGSKLPLLCPMDVRNYLYEPRIKNAIALIEKDTLDQQVTASLSQSSENPVTDSVTASISIIAIQAEKDQVSDRTQLIIAKADELRDKVERARQDFIRKKKILSQKKSDLVSASSVIDARRSRLFDDLEKSIQMLKVKWSQKHAATMSARAFLCGEAARLYGLKKARNKINKDEYKIGGSPIIDLERLNTASAAQISTALSNIVHLLVLSVHYLGIRLPAEIILPHRDYPFPTVLPLHSSYKNSSLSTLDSSVPQSRFNASSGAEMPHRSRPRPLFIQKPLPIVASEDASVYALFLEGVALLAYDIVWVCKSQGIDVGKETTFFDICKIGRNMFNLLIGARPRLPHGARVSKTRSLSTEESQQCIKSDKESGGSSNSTIMGKYSHNAAHSFLGSAEGISLIRTWGILSPAEITDRLRSLLMSEIANAEWEVLNDEAWEINPDDEVNENEVHIWPKIKADTPMSLGIQSYLSINNAIESVDICTAKDERKARTGGWTKLKPR
ncbi:hypothetical protein GcC1_174030 [Golovinomyces cichoracearum]|uniref:Autophagy-related protein 14 n=1 Tax=Golovinomyces cichoracearum TaxID=62708 RepID=A0A420HQ81_9PEZI|nr:hypothetical protein GcC1_174030 [Golovinomyces cichoracearum]